MQISCFSCKTSITVDVPHSVESFSDIAQKTGYSYAWRMHDGKKAAFACSVCSEKIETAMKVLESVLGADFEIRRDDKSNGSTVIWENDDCISFTLQDHTMVEVKKP